MRLTTSLTSTAIANGLAFGLSIGSSILLTRVLGAEGRGEFAIFTVSAALFTLLLSCGLDFAITYLLARRNAPTTGLLTTATLHACIGASIFFLVMAVNDRVLHREVFLPASKQQLGFEALSAALVFGSLLAVDLRALLMGARDFLSVNVLTIAAALFAVLFFGGAWLVDSLAWVHVSPGAVMTIYAGLALLNSMALLAAVLVRLPVSWSWALLPLGVAREGVRMASQGYLGQVLQFLSYRVDFWFVEHFHGLRALGLYSLASSLAQTAWLVPHSAASVFFPALASGDQRGIDGQLLLVRLALAVAVPAGIVGGLASGPLLTMVYGSEFAGAAGAFCWLLVGCIPFVACILLASGLAANGRQAVNARASFLGFLVTIAFDLLLIPRYGIVGASWASALSYLSTTAYVAWHYSKEFSVPLARILLIQRGDVVALRSALAGVLRRQPTPDAADMAPR